MDQLPEDPGRRLRFALAAAALALSMLVASLHAAHERGRPAEALDGDRPGHAGHVDVDPDNLNARQPLAPAPDPDRDVSFQSGEGQG
jgi:hypothetical protein